ncbi:uncharacterized protein LY79DRAFT_533143 [Colletotrichum navitas]|uniref:Uncharacterized protein n=1 Tax=Colletotrichum navitas TaxID=681940 RepID=A0AAD8QFD4_9PEZI|nr:uncharacterized protein LY79DRAFT_533143 [Colletotrichum navitas]KAK1600283.1 hypothetical protein LY79DRAFT_533143 [Colletotrichum navitas]
MSNSRGIETHLDFSVGPQPGNFSQQRSPQYKISNESASALAKGHGAPADSGHDGGFVVITRGEATASGPPSEATGSDDTVIDSAIMRRAAGAPAVLDSALTQNNIHLHDRVCPLGTMPIYQWIWGQPCPGGFDIKDTSSRESMKVHVAHSRASQAIDILENEYGVVNHPPESFIAFAGHWADVPAGPMTLDDDESDPLK